MDKENKRKYVENVSELHMKTLKQFINIMEVISSTERMDKCQLNEVLGNVCKLFDAFSATIHIRDEKLITGYDKETWNFKRKDVLFLFHLYIEKATMQNIFEEKKLVEIEEELRNKNDYLLMDDKSYLETQCLLKEGSSIGVYLYPSSNGYLSHLRAIIQDIKSSIAVPFKFSVSLESEYRVHAVLTLHFLKSKTLSDLDRYGLEKIISNLGSSLGATFRNIPVNPMHKLQGYLIASHPFNKKLDKICEVVSDVTTTSSSKKAYAHIRAFIPLRSEEHLGVLRMEGNAYYDKSPKDIKIEARNRLVLKKPEKEKGRKELEEEEEKSMSICTFKRALDRWEEISSTEKEISEELKNLPPEVKFLDSLKDRISYDKSQELLIFKGVMSEEEEEEKLLALSENKQYKKAIEAIFRKSRKKLEYTFDIADIQINKQKSPYTARIPGYESDVNNSQKRTLAQLAVPILAGDGYPLGVLTLNSSEFAWLNFCWLPIAVQFAKEASWVIEHEKGFTITKNEELKIDPKETIDETTEGLLRQVYLDEMVYKKMVLTFLEGYGKGSNYLAKIYHPIRKTEVMSLHIVRSMDRNKAEIEKRAYEIYVKNFLGVARFAPKVGEAFSHNNGLITYLMLGKGGLSFDSLHTVIKDHKPKDIRMWDTDVGRIKVIIEDLFSNLLKSWHSDEEGTFAPKDWPNIVQCYDRTEVLIREGREREDLFDRDIPGLFDRDTLEKAHEQYQEHSTRTAEMIKKIVEQYIEDLYKKFEKEIPYPYIGVCHGDLHDRNILVDKINKEKYVPWIIDFDCVHRGHVLQDFTRLESYVQHLILSDYRDPSEAEKILRNLDEILPEEPGEEQPEGLIEDKMKRFELASDLRYFLLIIQEIRSQARKLATGLYTPGEHKFRLQYYISLFFQYLDWFTFDLKKVRKSKALFIMGVGNLAIGANLLLEKIKEIIE